MTGVLDMGAEVADFVSVVRQHALGDILHRSAARYPGKLAVVDGQRRMTFADFDSAVNRCARCLADRGLGKADRLALLSHNCWQFAVLAFAAARLGVVLVPINFMLGVEEVRFILDHSEASALVCEDALADTGGKAALASGFGGLRGWISLSGSAPAAGWQDVDSWMDGDDHPPAPPVIVHDDDPLRLMYTSGTESRPKGVVLTSRSLISQYVSCIVDGGMSSGDVEVHALPMYHCAQLDCFFSVDIYLGATSVILPSADPVALLATVESERVTKLFAPPTVWISLLRHPDFDRRDLSSLRKGYYGASPMPVEILKEMARRLPEVRFWNFYGQTEMSPVAAILGPDDQLLHAGSAGRAALNVETRIVDDADRSVPRGEIGEIVHRSPHATLGYHNDEEKSAAAFRNGWFHSGDLGRVDASGFLVVVDRKKDMIKSGGENVASREVEEAIYLLDGVAEVAVVGVAHPRWIEAVTAVIVPKAGFSLTEDQVIEHTRDILASYKRPKYVVFAEALPKNPSGKILKKELRQNYAHLC